MKNFTRRKFLATASAGTASVALGVNGVPALAETKKFPSEPIDIIVPFGVGGGTDIWLRTISVALATKKNLRVPINIRNIPGAASLRGTGVGFTAKPDGQTLTAFNPPSTPWAWFLHNPPFDIEKFKGISVYVREPGIIVARPGAKVKDFSQMVNAYNSGELKIIASQQAGTIWHIAATLMKNRSGVNWQQYVSYKGTGDIIAALIRKEVDVGIVTASSAFDHVKDGKLVPLAIVGMDERMGSFPNVPTMNEFGMDPLKVCVLRRSVFAPPGIDEERREILEQAFIKAQDHLIVKAQYDSLSLKPARGTGAEAEESIRDAIKVAKEIDLKSITKK